MTEPATLVLDDVPEELDELRRALRRRYGLEYVVICESSAAAASDRLARLAADGRPVAIVCASAAMIDTGGGEVLAMAHRLQAGPNSAAGRSFGAQSARPCRVVARRVGGAISAALDNPRSRRHISAIASRN